MTTMEISRADWCRRFANALLVLDRSSSPTEADWISEAAYPSAQLLVPEEAAEKLVGLAVRHPPDDETPTRKARDSA
jgi:hypothetical protein